MITNSISLKQLFTDADYKKMRLKKIIHQVNPRAGKKRKSEQTVDEPPER